MAALTALLLAGCAVPVSPLTDTEIGAAATLQRTAVAADQEALTHPVGLYDAMARALKYNLDYQVEAVQTALRSTQ